MKQLRKSAYTQVFAAFLLGASIGWLVARRLAMSFNPGYVRRNREANAEPQTWTSADGTATVTWYPGAWVQG